MVCFHNGNVLWVYWISFFKKNYRGVTVSWKFSAFHFYIINTEVLTIRNNVCVNCNTFFVDIKACDFMDLTEQTHDIIPHAQVIGWCLKLICQYASLLHYHALVDRERFHFISYKDCKPPSTEIGKCHELPIGYRVFLLYCHMNIVLFFCAYLFVHWFHLLHWSYPLSEYLIWNIHHVWHYSLCAMMVNSWYFFHIPSIAGNIF